MKTIQPLLYSTAPANSLSLKPNFTDFCKGFDLFGKNNPLKTLKAIENVLQISQYETCVSDGLMDIRYYVSRSNCVGLAH